jgi:hypothetical protein
VSGPAVDPPRGLLGVGAAGLAIEALVVLLAAPAVVSLDRGHVSGWGVGYVLAVAVLLVLAAARLRAPGGKVFASVLQVLVVAAGVVTWPMYVVGASFAGIWLWWLRQWPRPARS